MQQALALPTPIAETYTAHFTADPAVQSNEVYLTPCITVPSISFASASDNLYSLGLTKQLMLREPRIARTLGDLERELIDQLQLLRRDCEQYDSSFEPAGKRIALCLRVLLHHHGQSKSLLHQLGLRSGQFLDTAGPLKPDNHAPEFKLVAIEMSSQSVRFLPLIATGGNPENERMVPFEEWWTEPVMKDAKQALFSRKDLVSQVADTDGGAHVDPDLTETYMALSRQNSIGGTFQRGKLTLPLEGRIELACMRQIAHEALSTLHAGSSGFPPEANPVIPSPRASTGQQIVTIQYFEFGPRLSEGE